MAGASVAGSLLSKTPKQTSTSEPWKAQQPYLLDAFKNAQNIFNQQSGTPFYDGGLYAPMDPLTKQGVDATAGYATGAGNAAATGVANSASPLLSAGQGSLDLYGNLATAAQADPTQANITNAGLYANNPFINGQIDAASRDVVRNLGENIIPGINRNASGSGNINSTRTGMAEGIAKRGAADRIADIASTMRGAAYDRGLGLSESARTSNLGALGGAAAGMSGVYGQGLAGSDLGSSMNFRNLDALVRAGQLSQADAQGLLNEAYQRWQGNDTRQSDLLSRYMGIIGGNNWGGTTTQTGQKPNPIQAGLGGFISGLGMFGGGGGGGGGGGYMPFMGAPSLYLGA